MYSKAGLINSLAVLIADDSLTSNEIKYTGAISEEKTGLIYLNARHYDPNTGRFLQQDTYKGDAATPWTQHLYAYCGNNPVNMVDPSGHNPVAIVGGGIVVILAVIGMTATTGTAMITSSSAGLLPRSSGGFAFEAQRKISLVFDVLTSSIPTTTFDLDSVPNKEQYQERVDWARRQYGPKTSTGTVQSSKTPDYDVKIPQQGTIPGTVVGAPPIDAGSQGKHVQGHNNNVPEKSQWAGGKTGVTETQQGWLKGIDARGNTKFGMRAL